MVKSSLLSIVVPVCNEEANLLPLYERLVAALGRLSMEFEVIFVDDGSRDGSEDVVRRLHRRDTRVRALFFTRNFGHERALTAGIDAAQGDAIVLMDADLQDPPELIPSLVTAWHDGFEIVGARRRSRDGDPAAKRLGAYFFYRLMRRLAPWTMAEDTGNFCLIDRHVAEAFRRCREWNRFVRVLLSWTGYRQTSIYYDRPPRVAGTTKYGLLKQLGLAATSITSFSLLPLRAIGLVGLCLCIGAMLAFGGLLVLMAGGAAISTTVLLVTSLWLLGGIQLVALGVVGEYVGRTLLESQRRPLYFIRETLGFERARLHDESATVQNDSSRFEVRS